MKKTNHCESTFSAVIFLSSFIILFSEIIYCHQCFTLFSTNVMCKKWKKKIIMNHINRNERRDAFWHLLPTKTLISLRIRAVWSESSLSAWRNFVSLAGWSESTLGAHSGLDVRFLRLLFIRLWWRRFQFEYYLYCLSGYIRLRKYNYNMKHVSIIRLPLVLKHYDADLEISLDAIFSWERAFIHVARTYDKMLLL